MPADYLFRWSMEIGVILALDINWAHAQEKYILLDQEKLK
jgi:hypothetical protein